MKHTFQEKIENINLQGGDKQRQGLVKRMLEAKNAG